MRTPWNRIVTISRFLLFFLFLPPLHTTHAAVYPPGPWDHVFENQTFTQPLVLDTGYDNTLIINSVFENITGDAMTLRNVRNIYITGNTFKNITNNGIVFRSTGSTDRVTIDGNTMHDISDTGILPKRSTDQTVDHTNLRIINNTIYNVGTDGLDHGMYVMAKDAFIKGNIIHDSAGNGISMRSSGTISSNIIWNTHKSCIRYFSDHETGSSRRLVVENNMCSNALDADYPLISLLYSPGSPLTNLPDRYDIRFNTLFSPNTLNPGIQVQSVEFDPKNVHVYGNISINAQNTQRAILNQYIDYLSRNYIDTSAGFIQQTSPYNFHLTSFSRALGYATGETEFPQVDIDGDTRQASRLDAGADQTAVIVASSADANADGRVDGLDYVVWLTHYNQNVSGASKGNFNTDEIVDGLDYVIWATNYGR